MGQHQRTKWKDVLRLLRDEVRERIGTEPDHAIKHHRADETLRDLLEEVLLEPEKQSGRHGESGFETEDNKIRTRCYCGHRTGWYTDASTAASAMATHAYMAPRGRTT